MRLIKILQPIFEEWFIGSTASALLRHDGNGLPFMEIQITESLLPDPFPCVTVKVWPNGKGN